MVSLLALGTWSVKRPPVRGSWGSSKASLSVGEQPSSGAPCAKETRDALGQWTDI